MPTLEQEFKLKTSKIYYLLISFMCALTLVAILLLPWQLMLIGFIAVGIYGGVLFWQHKHKGIVSIVHQDGCWCVKTRGERYEAKLCGDSVVTAYVSVLRFDVGRMFFKPACVVFKDSFADDEYRKLVVICRRH